MSRAATTRTVGDQITTLLTGFTLTTAAREMVSRFVHAEQQPALPLLLRGPGARSAGATRAPHHAVAPRLEAAAGQDVRHAR